MEKPKEDEERKVHKKPMPYAAGIGIYIGFVVVFLVFLGCRDLQSIAILVGSFLILAIGTVDDWYKTHDKEFPILPRLAVQIAAAVIIYKSGIVFTGFSNPFNDGMVILPAWLQFLATITWIVGVTTVINFTDGLDGLAGGLVSISAVTLFVVAMAKGQSESALMAITLAGVSVSYLRYNKYPAEILMGDAGATFLGFILSIIALDGAFKQATVLSLFIPILALGVPILDNLFVIFKRIREGKPFYKADASQVHYRLLSSGLNQRQVVVFLYLVSMCLSLTSIILLLLNV